MEFHERVKKLMIDAWGTKRGALARFAEKTGLSKNTLTYLMTPGSDPQLSTIKRLSETMKVDFGWLSTGEDGPSVLMQQALHREMEQLSMAEKEINRLNDELSKAREAERRWKKLYESSVGK